MSTVFYQKISNWSTTHKKGEGIGLYPKGQFFKNTAYLEKDMPYFAFVSTKAVLRMP